MPNRCSHCKQVGHNRTSCPHDAWYAVQLREAYNAERREEQRRFNERARISVNSANNARRIVVNAANQTNEEFLAAVETQLADMQRRLQELGGGALAQPVPSGPTVRERKVQEILFDHCQEIPEGLYKELMDALVLRN